MYTEEIINLKIIFEPAYTYSFTQSPIVELHIPDTAIFGNTTQLAVTIFLTLIVKRNKHNTLLDNIIYNVLWSTIQFQ